MSTITPKGFVSPSVRRFDSPDLEGIAPLESMGFLPDEHVLLRGNPVVPTIWGRARTATSAEGLYYVGRPALEDIHPDAYVRFVANSDTWDPISCVWRPQVSGAVGRYQLGSAPSVAPLLGEQRYQIGRELLNARALSLESTDVLTSSFNEGFDSAYSFTLGMAIRPRSLSFDPIVFLDGSYVGIRPTGLQARFDGHSFTVPMTRSPQEVMPLLIVLEVSPPTVRLTAGVSPSLSFTGSSTVEERTTSFIFTLSGEYDLFSLDIWGDERPTLTEILAGYGSALGTSR